jgi:acetyl esterase/lipase
MRRFWEGDDFSDTRAGGRGYTFTDDLSGEDSGMSSGRIALTLAALVGLVAPAAAQDTSLRVEKHLDIAYRTDSDADKERHKLDVYVPKGKKDFPVLFFVHGGSWRTGNKGLYAALGNSFAGAGVGVVIVNYRLSPKVKHPAHIEDVAKAFAWTCENVGKYGGKADQVFACGHSAGGHLVSLMATDPSWLKAEKRTPADIRGVVAISGVYSIDTEFPLFANVFGKNPEVCKAASPLTHVAGKHPPFLIAYADSDFASLDKMAIDLDAALKKCASPTTLVKLADRNHYTIILMLIDAADPLHKAVAEFIGKHAK